MIIKNNNLINYVNYYFIIIVPEKPIWGGSIKYVCMYVCMYDQLYHYLTKNCILSKRILRSDEGLTLETSAVIISVRRSIYIINSVDKTKNGLVLLPHRVGDTVASWFVRSTPDPVVWVRVRVLAGEIVVCSWERHFTLMVLLSTQMYKWVPANLMVGVTL